MKQYPAIALIELSGISAGILTADAMIKSAPIAVLKTGTVHRGKYLALVGGSVASVEEAYLTGKKTGGEQVVDHLLLPDIHPDVHNAILGERFTCSHESLGVIETTTIASIIKSADAGLKGADVRLVEIRLGDGMGGKAFAIFTGKLEEVETAVQIAKESVINSEFWINQTIIPRLHNDLADQIGQTTLFSRMNLQHLDGGE